MTISLTIPQGISLSLGYSGFFLLLYLLSLLLCFLVPLFSYLPFIYSAFHLIRGTQIAYGQSLTRLGAGALEAYPLGDCIPLINVTILSLDRIYHHNTCNRTQIRMY